MLTAVGELADYWKSVGFIFLSMLFVKTWCWSEILKNDTCVVIMEQITQISRSFMNLFNLQVHRMGNLVFDNLNSESVLKLKNAPWTPLINLVFTSYQKEQIAYNWYPNWVFDSMPVLVTWCSPNPRPLLSSLKIISTDHLLW
jgi:hypothetical protein